MILATIPFIVLLMVAFSQPGQFHDPTNALASGISQLKTTHDAGQHANGISVFSPMGGDPIFSITEKGLPNGTNWVVNVNGTGHVVSGDTFSGQYPPGTVINYTTFDTPLYYTNISGGSVAMENTNISVEIQYDHFAYIDGTMNPSNASISLNGAFQKARNGTFNLTVQQGTFAIRVTEFGFTPYEKNITLSPGQTDNLTINLTRAVSVPPPALHNPTPAKGYLIYVAAGAILAMSGGFSVFLYFRKKYGK